MLWHERGGRGQDAYLLLHGLGATGAVWRGRLPCARQPRRVARRRPARAWRLRRPAAIQRRRARDRAWPRRSTAIDPTASSGIRSASMSVLRSRAAGSACASPPCSVSGRRSTGREADVLAMAGARPQARAHLSRARTRRGRAIGRSPASMRASRRMSALLERGVVSVEGGYPARDRSAHRARRGRAVCDAGRRARAVRCCSRAARPTRW